jgi:hypothetical protein
MIIGGRNALFFLEDPQAGSLSSRTANFPAALPLLQAVQFAF